MAGISTWETEKGRFGSTWDICAYFTAANTNFAAIKPHWSPLTSNLRTRQHELARQYSGISGLHFQKNTTGSLLLNIRLEGLQTAGLTQTPLPLMGAVNSAQPGEPWQLSQDSTSCSLEWVELLIFILRELCQVSWDERELHGWACRLGRVGWSCHSMQHPALPAKTPSSEDWAFLKTP